MAVGRFANSLYPKVKMDVCIFNNEYASNTCGVNIMQKKLTIILDDQVYDSITFIIFAQLFSFDSISIF